MILEAKKKSERGVGKELQKIKAKMESMNEKIKRVTERVARLEPNAGGILKADLQKSIAKLEEVWEGEVGTLKHELWQTIQAHNHNADLLKHHKDAIDQIQGRMADNVPNPELEQVHAHIVSVDKAMQMELAKEQKMEQLMNRLTAVQQQLQAVGGHWATAAGAAASFQTPAAPAASQAAGKRAQRKTAAKPAKSGKPPGSGSASQLGGPTLRAEAPEFVPTNAGWSES